MLHLQELGREDAKKDMLPHQKRGCSFAEANKVFMLRSFCDLVKLDARELKTVYKYLFTI